MIFLVTELYREDQLRWLTLFNRGYQVTLFVTRRDNFTSQQLSLLYNLSTKSLTHDSSGSRGYV